MPRSLVGRYTRGWTDERGPRGLEVTVVAGIDEAGLGPMIGPLVVTAVTLEVPDEVADESLWKLLSRTVTRRISRHGICIADSKKLYRGRRGTGGLAPLERGVLACIGALRAVPCDLAALLDRIAPHSREALGAYPWYAIEGVELPLAGRAEDAARDAGRMVRRMERAGVRLVDIRSEVVLEGEFNRLLEETGNKAEALFSVTRRVLTHVAVLSGDSRLLVHLDRLGGRMRYLAGLQCAFAGRWIWALREDSRSSLYRVDDGNREVELDFTVRSDDRELPVALASMVSKYVREVFMQLLNRYWTARVPGLEPTAGYHGDGGRFFGQIERSLRELGVSPSLLVRQR